MRQDDNSVRRFRAAELAGRLRFHHHGEIVLRPRIVRERGAAKPKQRARIIRKHTLGGVDIAIIVDDPVAIEIEEPEIDLRIDRAGIGGALRPFDSAARIGADALAVP